MLRRVSICLLAFASCVLVAYGLQNRSRVDVETEAPLSPAEAAGTMAVPEGFNVTLFAAEPDVKQPIAFCIDDRGRLWVAEANNYPVKRSDNTGDRILILEDADGDGQFDKRTVFCDKLNFVTGVEVGFGGAWVMSPPYFYFIPDRNGDDQPDGEPQLLLDGFGVDGENSHNIASALSWGPDGWLYGTHGRTNWSLLGKPGTPAAERIRFDGGVYRYHPVRHVWEPFADGTTNPWGIDWDDYGEGFVCNCVNPHLFHVVQGAHYEPWRNRESSRFAYERIPTIADHLHFVGRHAAEKVGSKAEDEAGGGHAHCGTMVYLGDNWPDRYRNTVFMNNVHGKRINNDILKRAGSGYTASHGPDLMRSKDPWFMGVTLKYGPDGAVFVSDWSDTGECHSVKNTRHETGRIFKIAYGKPTASQVDLASLTDLDLVKLQLHHNDWHVQHARRLLQEHAAAGRDMTEASRQLHALFAEQKDVTRKLRALWALHVIGALDDEYLVRQLNDASEYVRSWAIRLLCEDRDPPAAALHRFQELAASGKSPFERLYLASSLQRLTPEQRWPLAEALLSRSVDANDPNLPLMIWYGVEPLVHDDVDRFVTLAGTAKIPLVRRHIGRRAASLVDTKVTNANDEVLVTLTRLLATSDDAVRQDVLAGMIQGLEGRRSALMPENWQQAYATMQTSPNESVREQSLQLAVTFDDPVAFQFLRTQAADEKATETARNRAIQALVAKQPAEVATLLIELVSDPVTRSAAIRGLAECDHPQTVDTLLEGYESFDARARQDAVQTLASRQTWALALLDAVETNRVPRTDLTAYTARQLQNLNSEKVTSRLKALWGEVRSTPDDKAKQIAGFKKRITPEVIQRADPSAGRAVFQKLCSNCHKLFGEGGSIGPDITGSQRHNLDYLLENVIDASATVARDYQMQIIETTKGRTIAGLVVSENETAVTVQTINEKVVVPKNEIEDRATSQVSIMPDGMLQNLSFQEVCNLTAYLTGSAQVPLTEPDPPSK
jgi:putative membrane-bound dehydrogenase-like protein